MRILFLGQSQEAIVGKMFVSGLVLFYLTKSVGLTPDFLTVSEVPRWIFLLSHSHLTDWNNQQLQTELILPEDRCRPDGLRDVLVWNHRKFL